ncbi:MAG: NAD(P)H-quinone oxidoreductase subunit L [Cyanobacteria bacterium P01_D01_bin.73]
MPIPDFLPVPDLDLSFDVILTLALYVGIAGTYLLVIPAGLFIYLQKRWYVATSIERLIMYAMVFFFFPGMLAMSPFLNLRPKPRTIDG